MMHENSICFSNIHQPESWKIENYMASGGYLQWKKILQGQPGDKARQKIVEIIMESKVQQDASDIKIDFLELYIEL